MPETSGEKVAATEDTTAGSPEVGDIIASNSMDFLPVDQPHIKRDEDEGEITSESPDLGDTAASNSTENARHDFALVCGQFITPILQRLPIQILLLIKRENSEDTD
jgi:hypothetical protein